MDTQELLECIKFFEEIQVKETDVTTDEERADNSRAVTVEYAYKGTSFTTKRLYYKDIIHQTNVRNPENIIKYFGDKVYWLDKEKNNWARGAGKAELEKTIIDDMISDGDDDFKNFLMKVANNDKTGFIQRITAEGRTQQYHHNFENNNHWHDIIILIKEIIKNKGKKVDKKFFSRLVFRWDGKKGKPRNRTSLAKISKGKSRKFIDRLYENIRSIQNNISEMEIIKVLEEKGQIILQGAPGTGKTYAAKDMAEQIIFNNVSEDKELQMNRLERSSHFKLIQFHPAYSYEDFVRGIVAEGKGTQIDYITKNKVFAEFAKEAFNNWEAAKKPKEEVAKEIWLKEVLEDFKVSLSDKIDNEGEKLMITSNAYISRVTENTIRYDAINWKIDGGVPVSDIVKMYLANNASNKDVIDNTDLSKSARSQPTYWLKILEEFKKYIVDNHFIQPDTAESVNEKKYVLIIDEINRANLPAVLGELIYALEYRGDIVKSMYKTEEDGNDLIIPPNLFIIGTMNTSDRSVGHIDYAIRRRFAFIDVLPKILDSDFEVDLFKKVSALFISNVDEYVSNNGVVLKKSEHLSGEFRPEQVWLGHSYFINKEGDDFSLRKRYEIVPILKEYLNDGILNKSAEEIINDL